MRPQEIIRHKRDGGELSREEIASFVGGVVEGTWADYQASALLMAVYLNGMTTVEMEALTQAMLHSGEVLDFSDIAAPKADKHSTGGVGDKTSLVIAPRVAACGVCVPMISGRGLGRARRTRAARATSWKGLRAPASASTSGSPPRYSEASASP